MRLAICVAIAVSTWIIPAPSGMTEPGWHVFGAFAATIASFVLRAMPMGAAVLLALVALAVTGYGAPPAVDFQHWTITWSVYKSLVAGFGDTTVWLVVAAFLIAGAVERTGFGRRIALSLVHKFGRSTLGLGYSVSAAELVLGPCVPSNTARGGGIMAPIVLSLAEALDSHADRDPDRAGRYLMLVGAHANTITAAMFLTGMAANPLVASAAAQQLGVEFGWGTWALGALVPGLTALALLPALLYWIERPTLANASAARNRAAQDLDGMGAWSRGQQIMGGVFVLLLGLWATSKWHGMHSGLVAWIGVCALLVTGTEKWKDIAGNSRAWDTLVWLGGLLAMANLLKDTGVIGWFAAEIQTQVSGLSSVTLVLVLGIVYFYSMYGFSMLTAHISAMVAAFMGVAAVAGAPPMLTVAVLAYFSNLCACTTNYSTGPTIVYFGFGYVPAPTWFKIGAIMSVFHIALWFSVGMLWWKLLGWW